jgi:ABC-type transporter lipoprotein component MlaA
MAVNNFLISSVQSITIVAWGYSENQSNDKNLGVMLNNSYSNIIKIRPAYLQYRSIKAATAGLKSVYPLPKQYNKIQNEDVLS